MSVLEEPACWEGKKSLVDFAGGKPRTSDRFCLPAGAQNLALLCSACRPRQGVG
jgi:hypothetical protein